MDHRHFSTLEPSKYYKHVPPVVRFLQRHIRPVALFTSKRSYCGAFSSTSKINKKHAPPHSVRKCIPRRFSEHKVLQKENYTEPFEPNHQSSHILNLAKPTLNLAKKMHFAMWAPAVIVVVPFPCAAYTNRFSASPLKTLTLAGDQLFAFLPRFNK